MVENLLKVGWFEFAVFPTAVVMHRRYLAAKSHLKDLRMSRIESMIPGLPGKWLIHDATKDLLLKVTL